jgi:hypothetical protein
LNDLREIALNEINCYKGQRGESALVNATETIDLDWPTPRPLLGALDHNTKRLTKGSRVIPVSQIRNTTELTDETGNSGKRTEQQLRSVRGAYGHQLRPVRD